MTTALIVLYCTTYVFSFIMAIGSEDSQRSRAGTTLTVWSLVLLTGVVIADKVWDL